MTAQNNGPTAAVTSWVMTILSAVFLCLRFYCKLSRHQAPWWDEYILTFAWVCPFSLRFDSPLIAIWKICLLLSSSIISATVAKGFGKHVHNIEPAEIATIMKLFNIGVVFAITAASLSKTSWAVTLLRIERGWVRILLWFIIVSMNVLMGLTALFHYVQCSPVARSWDNTLPGTCWPPDVLTDFAIASGGKTLTIPMIFRESNMFPRKHILEEWTSSLR